MSPQTTNRSELLVAFGLTVIARALFHWWTGFVFDDAFISFRYSAHLAAGHGFVYNLGERVLGTTTPLWTLILAAFKSLALPILPVAQVISFFSSGITGVIILLYARSLEFGRLALLPVIVYALFPRSLPMETAGMETALFTMLITAGMYLIWRQRFLPAFSISALAILVRPEGVVLLGLAGLLCLRFRPRQFFPGILIAVILVVPWILFAWSYFGSPLPNSIAAKLALYGEVWSKPPIDNFYFLMGWHHPLAWLMAFGAIIGSWKLWHSKRFGFVEVAWIFVLIGGYTFSETKVFRWYVAPIYPVYILLASGFALSLKRLLPARMVAYGRGDILAIGLVALVLLAANCRTIAHYDLEWQALTRIHQGIVNYVEPRSQPGQVLATEDIGEVGYYCHLKILDRAGLVSPEVIPFNQERDYFGLIDHFRPDWVVISPWDPTSGFLQNPVFHAQYQFCKRFPPPHTDEWSFDLYRLRSDEREEELP